MNEQKTYSEIMEEQWILGDNKVVKLLEPYKNIILAYTAHCMEMLEQELKGEK